MLELTLAVADLDLNQVGPLSALALAAWAELRLLPPMRRAIALQERIARALGVPVDDQDHDHQPPAALSARSS